MPYDQDDDTVVWFSIPLDGPTIDRLMELSNICHADPVKVAASLLRDILADDEFFNEAEPAAPQRLQNLN